MHVLTKSLVGAAASALMLAAVPAQAQQKFATIGTGGVTGVYYAVGGAVCRGRSAAEFVDRHDRRRQHAEALER